ncbi:stearoyl-CoA desaturase 5-like [Sycon ciliatum]|uniref:stearoyl-CoA desaturase 5-like n=1 Tax=Sycon ciliatum TaxID=27933 RepID=UPI0031F681AC
MAENREEVDPAEAVSTSVAAKIGTDAAWRPKLKYHMVFFLSLAHFLALVGLVLTLRHSHPLRILLEVVIGWQIAGLGITVGAHRLWAHRSFKASAPVRLVLMLMSCASHQGSVYHWSRDHRIHHKFSETDADPHNSHRGFFFSHMGWLIREKHPLVLKKGKELDMSDLEADPIIMFQHRNYLWMSFIFAYFLPGLFGYFVHQDFWLGFFAHGYLRHAVLLHATWMVNSVAHAYGNRPYSPNIRPAQSLLVAVCALGEGWHNWHHTYPFDYSTSEYGIFGEYNPSKLFIDVCCLFGLASGRRRATHLWEKKKLRLAEQKAQ